MYKKIRQKNTKELQQKKWTAHFRELLNRQLPEQSVEIPTAAEILDVSWQPPTRREV